MCVVLLRRSETTSQPCLRRFSDQITRRTHQWTGGLLPIVPLGQLLQPRRGCGAGGHWAGPLTADRRRA